VFSILYGEPFNRHFRVCGRNTKLDNYDDNDDDDDDDDD
jgi:hypothetical protein